MSLFAVSSIAIVGIGQNFVDNLFIIPLPTKEKELSSICYSFTIYDPTIEDPRRNNIGNVIFGIIVPRVFIEYLGNVEIESFSITKKIQKAKSFQDLLEQVDFLEETNETLRNLLLNKII